MYYYLWLLCTILSMAIIFIIMYYRYFDHSYSLKTDGSTFFATASIMAVKVACQNSKGREYFTRRNKQPTNSTNQGCNKLKYGFYNDFIMLLQWFYNGFTMVYIIYGFIHGLQQANPFGCYEL